MFLRLNVSLSLFFTLTIVFPFFQFGITPDCTDTSLQRGGDPISWLMKNSILIELKEEKWHAESWLSEGLRCCVFMYLGH